MESLISFDGISDVGNNLINKVAGAVGWMVNHSTPKREALSTYIEGVKAMDISPLEKAAFISDATRIIKAYKNQNDIIQQAVQYLKPSAQAEKMSDDWIAQFMDKAGRVYDADFQIIWGKILAEEANEPGSIPKAVLYILEQMDKDRAEIFSIVCAFSVCLSTDAGEEYYPIIPFRQYKSFFEDNGLTYDGLVDLKAIGLIEMDFPMIGNNAFIAGGLVNPVVRYFGHTYRFADGTESVPVGNVIFTRVGHALCRAVGQQEQESFFENCCIPFWERRRDE